MCNSKKTMTQSTAISNIAIGDKFYRLSLLIEDKIASNIAAGQFAEIEVATLACPENYTTSRTPILRRPFSFAGVKTNDAGQTIADILYCVLGPGTQRMTTIKPGDTINIIAPLGNSFTTAPDQKTAILIGGGMGAAPLQCLVQHLNANRSDIDIIAFIGAQTTKGLPFFHVHTQFDAGKKIDDITEFSQYDAKTYIATDDGSAGHKGFVTEIVDQWLIQNKPDNSTATIYTCGPEVMMAAVAKLARKHDLHCQVSLERMMACGTGLCQGCAVECKTDSDNHEQTIFKLCCKDGPVFDSKEVCW